VPRCSRARAGSDGAPPPPLRLASPRFAPALRGFRPGSVDAPEVHDLEELAAGPVRGPSWSPPGPTPVRRRSPAVDLEEPESAEQDAPPGFRWLTLPPATRGSR
jgi:hypothetical protein